MKRNIINIPNVRSIIQSALMLVCVSCLYASSQVTVPQYMAQPIVDTMQVSRTFVVEQQEDRADNIPLYVISEFDAPSTYSPSFVRRKRRERQQPLQIGELQVDARSLTEALFSSKTGKPVSKRGMLKVNDLEVPFEQVYESDSSQYIMPDDLSENANEAATHTVYRFTITLDSKNTLANPAIAGKQITVFLTQYQDRKQPLLTMANGNMVSPAEYKPHMYACRLAKFMVKKDKLATGSDFIIDVRDKFGTKKVRGKFTAMQQSPAKMSKNQRIRWRPFVYEHNGKQESRIVPSYLRKQGRPITDKENKPIKNAYKVLDDIVIQNDYNYYMITLETVYNGYTVFPQDIKKDEIQFDSPYYVMHEIKDQVTMDINGDSFDIARLLAIVQEIINQQKDSDSITARDFKLIIEGKEKELTNIHIHPLKRTYGGQLGFVVSVSYYIDANDQDTETNINFAVISKVKGGSYANEKITSKEEEDAFILSVMLDEMETGQQGTNTYKVWGNSASAALEDKGYPVIVTTISDGKVDDFHIAYRPAEQPKINDEEHRYNASIIDHTPLQMQLRIGKEFIQQQIAAVTAKHERRSTQIKQKFSSKLDEISVEKERLMQENAKLRDENSSLQKAKKHSEMNLGRKIDALATQTETLQRANQAKDAAIEDLQSTIQQIQSGDTEANQPDYSYMQRFDMEDDMAINGPEKKTNKLQNFWNAYWKPIVGIVGLMLAIVAEGLVYDWSHIPIRWRMSFYEFAIACGLM